MKIIWASAGHRPEIHDKGLQKFFSEQNCDVVDITPYNKSKYLFFSNTLKGLFKYLCFFFAFSEIKFLILASNVSFSRKLFYLSQLGLINSIAQKHSRVINVIFRGNNIPLIQILHAYKNIRTMIIPHGLYFSDPPENNFFYYADLILTGTKVWPNECYQGRKIYAGMIENIQLQKLPKQPKKVLDLSLCTTHGRVYEAMEINKILATLDKNKFNTNIRFHPRNIELKNDVTLNGNLYQYHMQQMQISKYIHFFDVFIFTVGHNNRVSNVIYEAALCEKPVLIVTNKEVEIVNIPKKLNKYVISIENLPNTDSIIENGNTLKDILLESIFQSKNIYNDIFINLKEVN